MLFGNRHRPAFEMIEPAPADERKGDLLAGMLTGKCLGRPNQIGIESATQTAIGGDKQKIDILLFTGSEEGMREGLALGGKVLQHRFQLLSVGPSGECSLLRPAQPGGGDHLHRLGNLLDVADRRDAPTDRFEGSHEGFYAVKLSLNSLKAALMRSLRSSVNSFF